MPTTQWTATTVIADIRKFLDYALAPGHTSGKDKIFKENDHERKALYNRAAFNRPLSR